MFIPLNEKISVAGQISPDDVGQAAAAGFVAIINNRPDGETPDQPAGSDIAAAAAAHGLRYVAIPVEHSGLSMEQVVAMAEALEAASGPVLAFCRSGTRSTNLWALAAARSGMAADAIIADAWRGGYDVSRLRPALEQLGAA